MTKRDREDFGRTVQRLTERRVDGRDTIMDAATLHRISGSIHRYDELVCSVEMSERETQRVEKRVTNLEKKAREIASAYGFRAFFQGDCRGCPLYLIAEDIIPNSDRLADIHAKDAGWTMVNRWIESNYTRGHAVVWLG